MTLPPELLAEFFPLPRVRDTYEIVCSMEGMPRSDAEAPRLEVRSAGHLEPPDHWELVQPFGVAALFAFEELHREPPVTLDLHVELLRAEEPGLLL